jgi:hypothetical protein
MTTTMMTIQSQVGMGDPFVLGVCRVYGEPIRNEA